ncbi:MAG: pyridoxamine 5'-phosphate oxidase family protein [Puniceicoccales bacterium]|nr:pyridoxamine 5'-phosphate oxidase family protein [Puniceicoccales bacterium]
MEDHSHIREIRRKDRILPAEGMDALLETGEYGFLASCSPNGYPYGIPISFIRDGNSIYFHCASEGHKIDNFKSNDKASFCVVGKTQVMPDKFTTAYESVLVSGKIVMDLHDEERRKALRLLVKKYCPDFIEKGEFYMEKSFHRTNVLRLDIERITGKTKALNAPSTVKD